jgi:RNase P subunit RPR2
MSMFDSIRLPAILFCKKCGEPLASWQSKDGPCILAMLDFWEVDNFYAHCLKCGEWHEFNLDEPRPQLPLSAYKLTHRKTCFAEDGDGA